MNQTKWGGVVMNRVALVIGINRYPKLPPKPDGSSADLERAAVDAEAIATHLEQFGYFQRVERLPKREINGKIEIAPKGLINTQQLKTAIAELFHPEGNDIPYTALLFFAGHGLREKQGNFVDVVLAASDTNLTKWGVSLRWLRDVLKESEIRQKVVILDCCYSGEILNFKIADPGDGGEGYSHCFIAACTASQQAYRVDQHGLLTGVLLEGLAPQSEPINHLELSAFISKHPQWKKKKFNQKPIFSNSGNDLVFIPAFRDDSRKSVSILNPNICPYKGLETFDFNQTDPQYFYGRSTLTGEVIEKVRISNFLAVLGPSGSGKSSVVKAGLLYQISLGHRISGSDQWKILPIMRPGESPLSNLAHTLAIPANQNSIQLFKRLSELKGTALTEFIADHFPHERVILVIDQFEEAFILCKGTTAQEEERWQFFDCLIGALAHPQNKLCVIITMRADFLSECAEQEYFGLAKKIQQHLVTVTPLTANELDEAITEPAKQVGLEVERELITQMILDVKDCPGSLPLLQFTLKELWQQWHQEWQKSPFNLLNQLYFKVYDELGGINGTLEKRANQIFNDLSQPQQEIAKFIFIELTQLRRDTPNTRRQIIKVVLVEKLIRQKFCQELIQSVIQRLEFERLIVISDKLGKAVIDIVHEALIMNWSLLQGWLNQKRDLIEFSRELEKKAQEWENAGKPYDWAYLLQGSKLQEAKSFYDDPLLSALVIEFIGKSVRVQEIEEVTATLKKGLSDYRSEVDQIQDALHLLEESRLNSEQFNQSVCKIITFAKSLDNYFNNLLNNINKY
jgi:Caspase domain